MSYYFNRSIQATRHKVFVSYYHHDDQFYRDRFEESFGHLFFSKSVQPGDIDSDLSSEYIKRLIQKGYIADSSVVLVLVGPKTRCRKHVDREISAGLDKRLKGYAGLLGILLPEFPLTSDEKYYPEDLPGRLADNAQTGYAAIYTWNWVCTSESRIKDAIEQAFNRRISHAEKIDNSRNQLQRNLCE